MIEAFNIWRLLELTNKGGSRHKTHWLAHLLCGLFFFHRHPDMSLCPKRLLNASISWNHGTNYIFSGVLNIWFCSCKCLQSHGCLPSPLSMFGFFVCSKKSTEQMKKVPTIVLSVSYKGVKFIDATNKVTPPVTTVAVLRSVWTEIQILIELYLSVLIRIVCNNR